MKKEIVYCDSCNRVLGKDEHIRIEECDFCPQCADSNHRLIVCAHCGGKKPVGSIYSHSYVNLQGERVVKPLCRGCCVSDELYDCDSCGCFTPHTIEIADCTYCPICARNILSKATKQMAEIDAKIEEAKAK